MQKDTSTVLDYDNDPILNEGMSSWTTDNVHFVWRKVQHPFKVYINSAFGLFRYAYLKKEKGDRKNVYNKS